jgi:hypothetical protein
LNILSIHCDTGNMPGRDAIAMRVLRLQRVTPASDVPRAARANALAMAPGRPFRESPRIAHYRDGNDYKRRFHA